MPSTDQPTTAQSLIELTRKGPIHIVLIGLAVLWMVPTLGLAVTSFRSRGDISSSGWWTTISGQRSAESKTLELAVNAPGTVISVDASDSPLLIDSIDGYPAPSIGSVEVIEVRSELLVPDIREALDIPGIGQITVDANGGHSFERSSSFDGYFIVESVRYLGRTAFVDYRLTGKEQVTGLVEVEDVNDDKRIPRTGSLTVAEDGSTSFEARSAFIGTFTPTNVDGEGRILAADLEKRPIPVEYAIERAGGVLVSAAAGDTVVIPLAGILSVSEDGAYGFTAADNFIEGVVHSRVSALNPVLTLDNYRGVLQREDLPPPGFGENFINSIIVTLPSTLLPILLAAAAAYAFAWLQFPFRDTIYLVIIGLLVIPLQTTWVPVLGFLNAIGLNGEFAGIWLTHTSYGLPFSIFLLYSFFRDLPRDIFEAARIDGAGEGFIFFRIVIPLSTPAIAALAIFQFVWVWNDLMNALIFLDRDKAPLTIGIRNLLGQYGNEWNLLAAGAFVTMIVPLLVFLFFQRYFVRGLTAGAVKG